MFNTEQKAMGSHSQIGNRAALTHHEWLMDKRCSGRGASAHLRHTVSEWLRRWTRNPLGSARKGSNPFGVDACACCLPM